MCFGTSTPAVLKHAGAMSMPLIKSWRTCPDTTPGPATIIGIWMPPS